MMKRNRTLIMMFCAAVCILALCGCSKAEEVKSMFDPGSKLDIEYGMTVLDADSQDETIGIVVTNNNDKAASSVMLKLTPYDAEGNVMTYSEGGSEAGSSAEILLEISYIMPGEKAGLVVNDIPDLERSPDHVDVTVDQSGADVLVRNVDLFPAAVRTDAARRGDHPVAGDFTERGIFMQRVADSPCRSAVACRRGNLPVGCDLSARNPLDRGIHPLGKAYSIHQFCFCTILYSS